MRMIFFDGAYTIDFPEVTCFVLEHEIESIGKFIEDESNK